VIYTCTFPGCQALVESAHVACLTHWARVPKPIRKQVQERRIGWKDKAAAREFLKNWFLGELRKALPAVELPSPKPKPEPVLTVCGGHRPMNPRTAAALIKMFDAAFADLAAAER
jgi:hypothetical protein